MEILSQIFRSPEEKLDDAILKGDAKTVKKLLERKDFIVNKLSPFHAACRSSTREVVELLLKDPRVDVDRVDQDARTPFYCACWNKKLEVVKLLLTDERIDLNEGNRWEETPIMSLCSNGAENFGLPILEHILASGREIDLNKVNKKGKNCVEVAKENRRKEMASLMEKFMKEPEKTRHELRTKLGLTGF